MLRQQERRCAVDLTAYYGTLRATSLLRGLDDAALGGLLNALCPRTRRFARGEVLLLAGYPTAEIGIVLEGRLTARKTLPDGRSLVVTQMGPGGVFGDVLAGAGTPSPVTLTAAEPCLALFLAQSRLLAPCGVPDAPDPQAHWQVLRNLVETISGKYFTLDRRLELLMCKSLRARISLWALDEADRFGADTFTVPLTRAQLAETLSCDRSALSRELSRMRRDGLLESWRGSFKILDREGLQRRSQEG